MEATLPPASAATTGAVDAEDVAAAWSRALEGRVVELFDARVWSRLRVQGPGSRVQGSGSRVQGPGFTVQGLGSKV